MEKSINSIKCIIKETSGNQKILYVDEITSTHIAIKPHEGYYETPLFFEKQFLYKYDENLYKKLKLLYESGDNGGLDELWKKAISWED